MSIPDGRRTLVLLKARPTATQLADRLAPPVPEGLELYLAPADLVGDDFVRRTTGLFAPQRLPEGFEIVVEGPLRCIDGSFFDLSLDGPDARETIRRIVELGRALGARAANVHLIAPVASIAGIVGGARAARLRQCLSLASYYADSCLAAGMRPLVENIPPVARMRESGFWYTPIGMDVDDLLWLAERVPGIGLTVDVSHAQLYLNARSLAGADAPDGLAGLVEAIGAATPLPDARPATPVASLADYLAASLPHLVIVHVSNASGLLGEGLPYDDGDADLDAVVGLAIGRATYLVAETLDPDPDRAVQMREAQRRLTSLRNRVAGR
jgi:hypothetical protein